MSTTVQTLPSHRLSLGVQDVEVQVRESPQARTSRIRVGPERPLEIVVPVGTDAQQIDDWLVARKGWIASKLQVIEMARSRQRLLGLDQPDFAWVAGWPVPVKHGEGRRPVARFDGLNLTVHGVTPAQRSAALHRWYRREARKRIREITSTESSRLGLSYSSLAVRDQTTRWGSCSATGNLSFNWRLFIAPLDVMRYVVIHELCHLVVPNHSKAFWRQLEAAMPEWQEQSEWLSTYGAELRAYQPSA